MDLSVGGPGPRLAQRVVHLRAEGAYYVLARAQALEAEGRHVLHLEVGEPDFLASEEIIDSRGRGAARREGTLQPPRRIAGAAPGHRRAGRQARDPIRPSQVLVSPAPSRTCSSRRWR